MAYLLIAYPELKSSDFESIQSYRQQHDAQHNLVKPHFTFVFPVFNKIQNEFVAEIKERSVNVKAFEFTLRCATINKDAFSENFYTFLVPDEGYSDAVKLHDKLYSHKLKDNLRLDLDFIPHITIGNSTDPMECKQMADEWNIKDFSIKGWINQLSIVNYENGSVNEIEKIMLER